MLEGLRHVDHSLTERLVWHGIAEERINLTIRYCAEQLRIVDGRETGSLDVQGPWFSPLTCIVIPFAET